MSANVLELNKLAVDLARAGRDAQVKGAVVVEETARRIEDQAKEWAPRKGLPHYAETINHDVIVTGQRVRAEIGPDRRVNGQAKLAHIFEYGTSTLGPRAHVGPAFDRELPDFMEALQELGAEIL